MQVQSADQKIVKLLWEVGIPVHVHGYHYLLQAVHLMLLLPQATVSLSHQLYPCIAQHFHTTSSSVERSIRHAINMAWQRGHLTAADGIFGRSQNLTHDKPTNGEMIALLTEKTRMMMYDEATHQS